MVDCDLTDNLDLQFTEDGDLKHMFDIETSIITALFTDKRSDGKRGSFLLRHDEGSKLWKLDQSRIETQTLIDIRAYTRNSLSYLVEDGYASSYEVELEIVNSNIYISILVYKLDGSILERKYNI